MYIVCICSGYPEITTISICFNSFIRETYNSNYWSIFEGFEEFAVLSCISVTFGIN